MKVVIQRVKKGSVSVAGEKTGEIGAGLVILFGVGSLDNARDKKGAKKLAEKILSLRIFGDKNDKMNLSVLDVKGEILLIPQFTLYADCSKGNRPFFGDAANPKIAKPIFEALIAELKKSELRIEKGQFGAKMEVELVNDGPVTLIIEN